MSIIGSNVIAGASGQAGYNLTNSLRFRNSASAYLNRTPASTGNRQIMTFSFWMKRGLLTYAANYLNIFTAYPGASNQDMIAFSPSSDSFRVWFNGSTSADLITTQVFRDPSAWYHLVVAIDTTQATAANRIKMYVNGNQITSFSTATYPAQNYNTFWNSSSYAAAIGASLNGPQGYFDGYMTEINFIDGTALTPSSFGSTNSTTGVWQPAKYTGTYGTNGFYLNFSDTSAATAAAIGKDSSGNGNNWTPSGISVTAGVTYDAMTDVPTNTSATVANYAVLNPLDTGSNITLSAANLQTSQGAAAGISKGTIGISSGKWYWEVTLLSGTTAVGIADITSSRTQNYVGQTSTSYGYYSGTGSKYNNATGTSYGASYTTNDVIGVALDMDAGTLTFYKNNTSQGTAYSSLSGTFTPAIGNDQSNTTAFNAGQRPFSYTPPTGYVALNTYNLPTPTILQGNKYMDATLYTGTGASLAITNAGAFKPDFVWVKGRSGATSHALYDSVRGTTIDLVSDSTAAETTQTTGLTAFGTGGFTVGALAKMNTSAATYVGWQWQAGQGTTTTGTGTGGITSVTQSVNTTAGFSVVTYTGSGTNGTITHGLGVAPSMIIIKNRGSAVAWTAWHTSIANTQYLVLNTTAAVATGATWWNSTSPTSSVFSVGTSTSTNASAGTYVAYCWAEIAGFSKFGSYTGNYSVDGPFVYCGFRPKFILIKCTSQAYDWELIDTSRSTYNGASNYLQPNLSSAEYSTTTDILDIVSNGFKLRTNWTRVNDSSPNSFIFAAFAENPFKNALAR